MLIIGIGNEMRGDDAAGLYAVRLLNDLGVSAVEFNGDGASLMHLWRHQSEVIVIDAVKSGAAVGTIHCYQPNRMPLPANVFGVSTHTLGLAEAVELSRALGELPERLIVYGIEGHNFEMNQQISSSVQKAAETLSRALAVTRS